jgi:hypothetical protein
LPPLAEASGDDVAQAVTELIQSSSPEAARSTQERFLEAFLTEVPEGTEMLRRVLDGASGNSA